MIEALLRRVFRHSDIEHLGSLYMRRFFLTPKIRGWELVLHKICRPDADRAAHDHPGDFATLVLRGGYVESFLTPAGTLGHQAVAAGDLRFRSDNFSHRIDRILGDAAWTLCLRRRPSNQWGFWVNDPAGERPPRFIRAEDYFKPGYDRKTEPARVARG